MTLSELLDSLKEAVEGASAIEQAKRARAAHPSGWEPHVEDRGDGTGTLVSGPFKASEATPDEKGLIEGWGLDPAEWMIDGPVNVRRWQRYDGEYLHYYKANLVRRTGAGIEDYQELVNLIKKHKAHKPQPTGDEAFCVFIADTQAGKPDGDGTAGMVKRFLNCIDQVEQRIRELRKIGRPLGRLYVFGMGDIIEACDGHYAQQTFRTELNLRDQVKVMRRLILRAIQRWSKLFDEVVVAAVAGNHGEERRGGKSYTDFADNHDVAIFEQIAEILAENPEAYGHVRFQIPNDELSLTLDVCGTITTITHGHLAGKNGANAQQKQLEWWKKMAHGMQPAGESTLLITAHYHHFTVRQTGVKTHFQCPALEDRSDWYVNQSGEDAPAGMLTLVVGGGSWRDPQVLTGVV